METFAKKEIVLFPFPYTDLTSRKLRPCLILSNEMDEDIMLCQITSKYMPFNKFSVELKKDQTEEGSLEIDSYIRCNMIFTANKNQIKRKICKLNSKKYKEVISKINNIII